MTPDEIFEIMVKNKRVRLNIVKRSHKLFFYFYFPQYAEYPIAPFHEEMFRISQDDSIRNAVIAGFRGSAKSTIFSLSHVLWSIMGEPQVKYVLILSKTQQKAQTLLQHIKTALETNIRLKTDLGPFQEEKNQWNTISLHLQRYNAKITAASAEQSVRGLRHLNHRPQLIVCDDLEDMDSVKTLEGRDKLFSWLTRDVVPAGSSDMRLVVVGTILHEDGIIQRLIKLMESGDMNGVSRLYPVLDGNGNPAWPGKYPNVEALLKERRDKGILEAAWYAEYLLRPLPPDHQVVHGEWIRRYKMLPTFGLQYIILSVDPAVRETETADKTAIVVAKVYREEGRSRIYVLPNPVNERLKFPEIIQRIKSLIRLHGMDGRVVTVIEGVAAQHYLIQQLESDQYRVIGMIPKGDKRERLSHITPMLFDGTIRIPELGCEELETQLVGFGMENHDDLVDSLTMLVDYVVEKTPRPAGIFEFMKQQYEECIRNPLSPGSLAGWKRIADNQGL